MQAVSSSETRSLFNGLGGYAVLVDGPFGYFYRIAGAGNVTFTGNLTSGQPTISFTAVHWCRLSADLKWCAHGFSGRYSFDDDPIVSFTANTITLNANATSNQTNDTFTPTDPQVRPDHGSCFPWSGIGLPHRRMAAVQSAGNPTFYTKCPDSLP